MDEQILSELYSRFEKIDLNQYSKDIPLDHFIVTQDELKKMGIKYKKVKEKRKNRLYLFDKGDKIFRYTKSFYPNNSLFGFKVANDKMLTEKYLTYGGVNTTKSKIFNQNEYSQALKYIQKSDEKLVIKPLALDGGLGVFIDVKPSNFEYFWKECLLAQKRRKVKNPKLLIQEYVTGFEVRIIITEGSFMSATLRVPAHIKGDGKSSIEDLIHQKNLKRQDNPLLKDSPIKINKRLEKLLEYKHLNLKSILKNKEFCILYPQSNTQHGGENIEITSLINEKIRQQCVDAVIAIPGIHTSGIDIIIENFDDEEGTIIEVNKAPAFLLNYYPYIGKPQNPMKYIFKSLIIESRILRNKFDINELDELDLKILENRFKFNYLKQKSMEETIKILEKENLMLKAKLNKD